MIYNNILALLILRLKTFLSYLQQFKYKNDISNILY